MHDTSNRDSIFTPMKKPNENSFGGNTKDDRKEENNGIHPLYPINIDQPMKGVQVPSKPSKKPSKTDTKFPGPFTPQQPPIKHEPPSKYDFDNYDDIEEDDDNKKPLPVNGGIGPGFFNPLTKHQYSDYDQAIFNNGDYQRPHQQKPQKPNQYNPYVVQHGDGKHELINILGGNGQNLPPHLRIEHILQQFGNADENGHSQSTYSGHQTQNGLNYPFGLGQHPGLQLPNDPNQKVPIQQQGKKRKLFSFRSGAGIIEINLSETKAFPFVFTLLHRSTKLLA